jgi:hypothetical protein
MLAAIRILFLLGVRKVFLLGVDLDMTADKKYHFDQERSHGSIRGNNSTYKMLQDRFRLLKPQLDSVGFEVYNCNPDSKLATFPHMSYDDAVKIARHPKFPLDVTTERTEGLYDRKSNEQKRGGITPPQRPPRTPAQAAPMAGKTKGCTTCSRQQIEQVKTQVHQARAALHEAKDRTAVYQKLQEAKDPTFQPVALAELVRDEESKRKVFRRLLAVRNEMLGIK